MLSDLISTYGERLVIAVVGVGLAFIALIVVLWLVRRRGGPAPFLKGGRNRQPRLQVLDATAVDARRRLVLVRRDNVEHLIMIGGPTDIVVESGIGAIPIVTDITSRDQTRLDDLSEPSLQRSDVALNAPAPSITQEKPLAAALPVAPPEAKPEPIIKPTTAPAVARPAEPAARPVAEPAPKPAVIAVPNSAAQPVTSAQKPIAAPPQRAATPVAPIEAAKPSSPVQTAAMRPRPAAPQTQPAEPQVVATPVAASLPTGTLASTLAATANAAATASSSEPISPRQMDDIFSAARERVLPDLNGAAQQPKAAEPALEDSFSAELRDDFESFLNAEIEKNALPSDSKLTAEDFNLDRMSATKTPPITGASVDADAQKEMARIFGEMAVKRD